MGLQRVQNGIITRKREERKGRLGKVKCQIKTVGAHVIVNSH